MTKIYDDWERLVEAVMLREQLRQIACDHSRNPSYDSVFSFSSTSSFQELSAHDEENSQSPEFNSDTKNDDNEEITSRLGSQRFSVDEAGGKKTYIVGAKELLILKRRNSQYWDWTTHVDSRFSEVAVLHYGWSLDIRARMQTQMLSQSTLYSAYLVFKLTEWSKGLESAKAVVNFFGDESDRDAEKRAHTVHLQSGKDQRGQIAERRVDGWMEVEIGNFYVDGQDEGVEARILELTSWKMGLIVEGIEFRPLYGETQIVYPNSDELPVVNLIAIHDAGEDNQGITSGSSDLEGSPIFLDGDTDIDEARAVAEIEAIEETEIDISLLQEFVAVRPDPVTSAVSLLPLPSHSADKPTTTHHSASHKQHISGNEPTFTPDETVCSDSQTDKFCPDWGIKNNSSLQDHGVGVEMMANLLLPKDEPLLKSLTGEELFSRGYDSLSEVVYYFHGMKKMIEEKDRETDDLKQELLKHEVETQLALAAKDSELEELKKMVKVLKSDIDKAQDYARKEVRKAAEKTKEVQGKLEKAEARAVTAVENYKNSEELKVEKHKFASKAFAIGFEFCKKQVLEVNPGFDMNRVDIKRLEAPTTSSLSPN